MAGLMCLFKVVNCNWKLLSDYWIVYKNLIFFRTKMFDVDADVVTLVVATERHGLVRWSTSLLDWVMPWVLATSGDSLISATGMVEVIMIFLIISVILYFLILSISLVPPKKN